MTTVITIFIITYCFIIILPNHRWAVALASAAIMILMNTVPLDTVVSVLDWNIILMLFGTMGTVSFFIDSKMPNKLAEMFLLKTSNTMWAIVVMSLFAGVISAFMDNVATVLMLAPVGMAISKELKISPVPMLICISLSANLQGAATLVGDTTSIMLGGYADMDFFDFIFMDGKFGIFWAVELGALVTVPIIMFLFRKEKAPISVRKSAVVTDYVPTVLLCLNIILLILTSFIPNKPSITNGLICTGIFFISILYSIIKSKRIRPSISAIKSIDYKTLLLLSGLFIIIDGISNAGAIDALCSLFLKLGENNVFLMYTIIVWGSVIFSAFIDNIPYVATMLPLVSQISISMGCDPNLLYFGLLTGATLGGNLTPIGASANITTIGILQNKGYTVTFKDFAKFGVPFTLAAVTSGYLFTWFIWS